MQALQEKERIAKVLFMLRLLSEKTQREIGKGISVSFQQIQKYEKCLNGVSSDKLFSLAKQNNWDINVLFGSNPAELLEQIPSDKRRKVESQFKQIEHNIEEERKLQAYYEPLMPKLEQELAHKVTYKEPSISEVEIEQKKYA